MADSKITGLTSFDSSNTPYWPPAPASDVIPIVDISDNTMAASGTTKKISINNLLSSSPTAGGNFTITGDLTVRTNKLAVTSSGVGFGTASPFAPIQVGDTTGSPEIRLSGASTAAAGPYLTFYKGGTRKTLIGNEAVLIGSGTSDALMFYTEGGNGIKWNIGSSTPSMTLDSSGNLGIGVTPSAWATTFNVKAFQTAAGSLFNFSNTVISLTQNSFYNTSGGYSYANNGFASEYYQMDGKHIWRTAANNTLGAGATATFTQAMTLDASGNLLLAKTAVSQTTLGFMAEAAGTVTSTLASSTTGSTFNVYSTGAAAYRFYVGMNGTISATNTTISAISDARLKENVQDIDVGLGAILALKPRKFDWKAGKGKDIKGDRGFIAQEFEQVFPQLVDEWKDQAPEGEAPYKSVRQDLIPVLVKAIQELAAEINALKNA